MQTIHLIAAARPNFMKIAPLYHALKDASGFAVKVVHTGQHYDANMSGTFFEELGIGDPDYHLKVGSGTHAEQTGRTMIAYEKLIGDNRPDLTVVVGDVNATLACALVCAKMHIPLAHLEAGLRSWDRTMPEEINRIVTDSIADLLWTPSPDGDENLIAEGIPPTKIERVGNIMIDSLLMKWEAIESHRILEDLELSENQYIPITLHRPSNVDDVKKLTSIISALIEIEDSGTPVVFPVHPRTKLALEKSGLYERLESSSNIKLLEPLPYNAFLKLVSKAALLITDSGGIQEETTYLGVPCLTLRENTERPITVAQGTNRLVAAENLYDNVKSVLSSPRGHHQCPELWDGKTAARVVKAISRFLNS